MFFKPLLVNKSGSIPAIRVLFNEAIPSQNKAAFIYLIISANIRKTIQK